MLSNKALFPVQFHVDEVTTNFGDDYPPKRSYEVTEFTIPAGGSGWFDDHNIVINQRRTSVVVEGQIQCEFTYGKPGSLDNILKLNKRVYFVLNDRGDVANVNWVDQ